MSWLYLYAFASEPPAPGTRGLGGEPLTSLSFEGFSAACGITQARPVLTAEAVRGHDAAVRRVASGCRAVLPLRFGQLFEDERSLREAVAPLSDRLAAALKHVAGREQMTLDLWRRARGAAVRQRHRLSDGAV